MCRFTKHRETTLRTFVELGLRARLLLRASCSSIPSDSFIQRPSGRYIEYDKIYKPTELHCKPANRKQGSGAPLGTLRKAIASTVMSVSHAVSYASYIVLHKWLGVATEEARYTMPLSTATTLWLRCPCRLGSRYSTENWKDAQTDIQVLAGLIAEELGKVDGHLLRVIT